MKAYAGVKNQFKRGKLLRLLAVVVTGTASAAQCAFLKEKDADELATSDASLVTVNKAVKDAKDNVAVQATAAGIAASNDPENVADLTAIQTKEKTAVSSRPAPGSFVIQKGIPIPASKRAGVVNIYPFDTLEVGDCFDVSPTPERADPAKSMQSTVASATRRYKDATPKRKFIIRSVDGGAARIWRTE